MKASYQDADGASCVVELNAHESLRDALIKAGHPPHNASRFASCQGFGTCGTCAVQIEGEVEPKTPGAIEAWRLGFPPHTKEGGLRLACQVQPRGDLKVKKHKGFWGSEVEASADEGAREGE